MPKRKKEDIGFIRKLIGLILLPPIVGIIAIEFAKALWETIPSFTTAIGCIGLLIIAVIYYADEIQSMKEDLENGNWW